MAFSVGTKRVVENIPAHSIKMNVDKKEIIKNKRGLLAMLTKTTSKEGACVTLSSLMNLVWQTLGL